jgi:hypothetical protein
MLYIDSVTFFVIKRLFREDTGDFLSVFFGKMGKDTALKAVDKGCPVVVYYS